MKREISIINFSLTHIVNELPQIIMNIGPGFLLGVGVGGLLRFIIAKAIMFIAIPAAVLLFLDYANLYQVDWLCIRNMWESWVRPPLMNVFAYLNKHTLAGILPGIVIGIGLATFRKNR